MDTVKFRRHGDVNLHPITKEEYEKAQGKIMKHDGSYVVARGEATGSTHVLTVPKPEDMIIKEDGEIRMVALLRSATITHTTDHQPLIANPGYYIQIPEREVNHYANSLIRRVID